MAGAKRGGGGEREKGKREGSACSKGRTIRKLMGRGGGGVGEVQKKKFAQGKIK